MTYFIPKKKILNLSKDDLKVQQGFLIFVKGII